MHHHGQMQANAVSQRAAWVLVPRPLNYRLGDAASTRVAPRNGGIFFGGRHDACGIADTQLQLCALASRSDAANAVSRGTA